ncbi:MAG: hypothetical protein ABH846_02755 [Patescibacteria group bacterium]
MNKKPETPRMPPEQRPSQSELAAREYSLLAETQKEVRKLLEEEIHGARMLVEFYGKYYGKLGGGGEAHHALQERGLPPAGGVLLDFVRKHFGKDSNSSVFEDASDANLQIMWDDFLDEIASMSNSAYTLQNLQINSWMIEQRDQWRTRNEMLRLRAKHVLPSDAYYLTIALPPEDGDDPDKSIPSRKELIVWVENELAKEARRLSDEVGKEVITFSSERLRIQQIRNLELYFGKEYLTEIKKLLPNEFKQIINEVTFSNQVPSGKVNVFGEQKYGQADGRYDPRLKEITLVASDYQSMAHIPEILFHEAGHSIDFNEDLLTAMRIKLRFLEAVKNENNLFSMYAVYSYAHDGLQIGLQEDFAETVGEFFTNHKMLKKLNPERFAAMTDIVQFLYPGTDVTQVRENVARTHREARERSFTNPAVFRALVRENQQYMWSVLNMFHSNGFRPLDYWQLRGEANTKRTRQVAEIGMKIYETFDESGRLLEEVIEDAQKTTKNFTDPEYDEDGRLLSYKTEVGGHVYDVIHSYNNDDELPTKINYLFAGAVVRIVTYEKDGNEITEHVMSPLSSIPGLKSRYRLDSNNQKIIQIDALINNQTVFGRRFDYDDQGRLQAKVIVDQYGGEIYSSTYSYEDEQQLQQAA